MTSNNRPRVLILFGGRSGEHQISAATAGGVLAAINPRKWEPIAVGITPEGEWVPQPNDPLVYSLGEDGGYTVTGGDLRVALLPGTSELIHYEIDEDGQPIRETLKSLGKIDLVFPLLHGPYGEDGTAQGLFELANVRYVGCGVASSAVCQDKYLAKTVLAASGIDVGEWTTFTASQWRDDNATCVERVEKLGYPVFVKPTRAGSSLGVSKVASQGELAAAVDEATRHDPRIIVEAAVDGREIECGILGTADGSLTASALGEIRMQTEDFYDFESKYFDPEAVSLHCPADLPGGVAKRIQEIALVAFEAVEGEGISRVDFFYNEETGRIVLNEINTLPGFTPASLYPVMFERIGIAYSQLIDLLLEEAQSRPLALR